jgi:hypothetical protein
MSSIPPGFLGSILQTVGAKARAAADRQREQAGESERSGGFAERLADVIEETDRDSQVYSDAEGAGGQGRPDESAEEPAPEPPPAADPPASGLDLQA